MIAVLAAVAGAVTPRPLVLGHPVLDFRVGSFSVHPAHLAVCLELHPLAFASLEACGKTSEAAKPTFGFAGRNPPGMSRYRVRGVPWSKDLKEGLELAAVFGAGIAELQKGEDEGGFKFGKAEDPDQNEAAGPELCASARSRWWPHARFYLVADLNFAVAHLPAAPVVLGRGGSLVPSLGLTIGLGI